MQTKKDPIVLNETQKTLFDRLASVAPVYAYGPYLQNILKGLPNKYQPVSLNLISPQRLDEETSQLIESKFSPLFSPVKNDSMYFFYHEGINFVWLFMPDFNPNIINTQNGITIDQVFLNLNTYSLLDPTSAGISDIKNDPIIIRTTAAKDKWDNDLVANILIKISYFQKSEVSEEDLKIINNIDNLSIPDLSVILWMPYPSNTIRFLLNNTKNGMNTIFDSLLRLAPNLEVAVPETVSPKQVFSPKNLKLLDVYIDYFENQKVALKNNHREKTLLKILLHGEKV